MAAWAHQYQMLGIVIGHIFTTQVFDCLPVLQTSSNDIDFTINNRLQTVCVIFDNRAMAEPPKMQLSTRLSFWHQELLGCFSFQRSDQT